MNTGFAGITAAVAGTGFIGPVHVEALRRLGITVSGILGSDAGKSERAQRALGLPRAYASFAELLADRSVTAVHLAVPNILHHEFASRALAAGKHVLCEKPLAMDPIQSADLVARAKASGLHAGVCYNVRYYPLNLHARQILRRGDLGRVLSVHGSYTQDWLLKDTDYNWRVLADQGGALRAVADIGTHWLDLMRTITGLEATSLIADLRTVHAQRLRPRGEVATFTAAGSTGGGTTATLDPVSITTDDCGSVLLRLDGGASANLFVSQVSAGRKNSLRYEIAAERGCLAWDSEQPESLWLGRRDGPSERLTRDPSLIDPAVRGYTDYPGGHVEGFPDTFKQCFRAFYQAVAGCAPADGPGYPTFSDGHREVVLCAAILASHHNGGWVRVDDGLQQRSHQAT